MPSNVRERENLNSSIKASFERKQAIDPDLPKEVTAPTSQSGNLDAPENGIASGAAVIAKRNLSEPPRDPRDRGNLTPITASRPASPYTLNPPIDFDGLSWPST